MVIYDNSHNISDPITTDNFVMISILCPQGLVQPLMSTLSRFWPLEGVPSLTANRPLFFWFSNILSSAKSVLCCPVGLQNQFSVVLLGCKISAVLSCWTAKSVLCCPAGLQNQCCCPVGMPIIVQPFNMGSPLTSLPL